MAAMGDDRPPRPWVIADAHHETIHRDVGMSRIAKTRKDQPPMSSAIKRACSRTTRDCHDGLDARGCYAARYPTENYDEWSYCECRCHHDDDKPQEHTTMPKALNTGTTKRTRKTRDPVEDAFIVCRRRLSLLPKHQARSLVRYLVDEFSQLEIPGAICRDLRPQVGDIAAPGTLPWKPTVGPT